MAKQVRFLLLILTVVSVAIYANTLANGYVMDDGVVLNGNTLVKKGLNGIPQILTSPRLAGAENTYQSDFYRPLSMVMFAAEVQLFGLNPFVGHLVNVLVFIGCVLMLFLFLDGFFERKRTAVAFIAALLFAVHPVHTEVVANIKSRDELLCYFFGFWSLLCSLNYMYKGRVWLLVAGMITLFLSFLAKETVLTFVVLTPLIFFFYRNDNKRRATIITAATVVVTAIFLIIRAYILRNDAAGQFTGAVDFVENALSGAPNAATRFATSILILEKYLVLLFIPYPLLSDYSYNSISFVDFTNLWVLISLAVYLFLICLGIYRLIKYSKDPWAFAILFFLVTLSLFSNIPFLVGAEMAERFLFFASTGFCLAAALAVDKWVLGTKGVAGLRSARAIAVLLPVVLIFSVLTLQRNRDWKDNYTLYKTDLENSPSNARLANWLAAEIAQHLYLDEKTQEGRQERDAEAIRYLHQAIAIFPGYADALAELGWIYQRGHNLDSAFYYDRKAEELAPNSSTASENLGNLYYLLKKYAEAAELLKKTIALNPNHVPPYLILANCYLELRQPDRAIAICNEVLVSAPDNADAHEVLGTIYLASNKYDSAEIHFQKVLQIKPGYLVAINNLGVVYLNLKKYPQAAEQFKRAITRDANYMNAYSNLARTYFEAKQFQAAIDVINSGQNVNPNYKADLPILALSYQQLGNIQAAEKYAGQAKQLYPDFKLQ